MIPDTDIWERARHLRLLAATWRMSSPDELLDLLVPLIRLTGPAWDCMKDIAPAWIGYVERDEQGLLWRLLHSPAARACYRCIDLARPVERVEPAATGHVWCAYHLGGRFTNVSVGTEDGITVTRYAGAGA